MRKFFLLLLTLTLSYTLFAQQQGDFPKREFRAAWVATVVNLDWPYSKNNPPDVQKENMIHLLDELQKLNFNAVVFQVRAEGDAFYDSPYEPWSYYLTGKQGQAPNPYYDPLAFVVEEAHKRGMEVHAWFNPYRAERSQGSYTLDPKHVVKKKPEWILTVDNFKMLNPGLQEVRDYNTEVIMDVVRRYDVDAIHFDDYFYPYEGIGNKDAQTFAQYPRGFNNIADWRRDNVNIFIKQVYDSIKAEKPYVKFGVSPIGSWKPGYPSGVYGYNAYSNIYADAMAWLRMDALDYLTPQIYWSHSSSVPYDKMARWWADSTGKYNKHLYPGHAAYKAPDWAANEVERQIKRNRLDPDIQGSVFFRTRVGILDNPKNFADSLRLFYYKNPAFPVSYSYMDQIMPNPVGNLAYGKTGDALAALHWDVPTEASDGDTATWYAVYKLNNPSFTMADLENTDNLLGVTNQRYFVPETGNNQDQYFMITALDRNYNESFPSQVLQVALPEVPALAFPENGFGEFGNETPLTWNYEEGTASYRLQIATSEDFSVGAQLFDNILDTTYTLSGLEGETTYFWRVMALNAAGVSVFSEARSFTTGFPAAPALISPVHATYDIPFDAAQLVWADKELAESYEIQIAYENSFSPTRMVLDTTGITDTTLTVSGLAPNAVHWWRVKAVNGLGESGWSAPLGFKTQSSTGINDGQTSIPDEFNLVQNYPNPFNPTTVITYMVPEQSEVSLKVYDILGSEVASLVNGVKTPGTYEVTFNGSNLSSGVYFYVMRAGKFTSTRKLILMK